MDKRTIAEFIAWVQESPFVVPGKRVLVLRDAPQKTTKGGIVIPSTAQRKEKAGYLVAMGAECKLSGLQPGDRVIFTTYQSVELQLPWPGHDTVRVDMFDERDIYMGVRGDMTIDVASEEMK